MATYDLATGFVDKLEIGDIINCSYSGAVQSITLNAGTYQLEVWGAEGGYRSSATYSGKGGYTKGTLTLSENTSLYLYSGGSGASGGFNGGGRRYYSASTGGGASDIRIGLNSLYARVIVAGGGGSDGATNKKGMYGGGGLSAGGSATESYGTGGYGGGLNSVSDSSWQTTSQSTSTYSQSDAYAGFGFGGNGININSGYGGAGGSGWWGGSGSVPDGSGDDDRGGGGGSGFFLSSASTSYLPSGYLLDSKYYLTSTSGSRGDQSMTSPTGTTETGHSGNGYCRITVLDLVSTLLPLYVKKNNVWVQASLSYQKSSNSWNELL